MKKSLHNTMINNCELTDINKTRELSRLGLCKTAKFALRPVQNFHSKGSYNEKENQLNLENMNTHHFSTSRNYIYDQQTMTEIIQGMKQQNNQLRNKIKMQQTQIHYYEEQARTANLERKNCNNQNQCENAQSIINQKKKVQLANFKLKKQVENLEMQIKNLNKTIKSTSIRELQVQNKIYQQQLSSLTGKIISYQNSTTNINELNKIMEKEYFTSIKNKELEEIIKDKQVQLEKSARVIRKLKNLIVQKNAQIESNKLEKVKIQNAVSKNRNMDQFVHKSELVNKKKQLLAMTQTIQKLQVKLIQCQSKAQTLQQQNIDNMNRQTGKRKQILTQFQKLKKTNQTLEEALASALKKNTDVLPPLRLDKVPSLDNEFRKPKIPLYIKLEHIRQATEVLIFKLQENMIEFRQAPQFLTTMRQNTNVDTNLELFSSEKHKSASNHASQDCISIREIIQCLGRHPFSIKQYEFKQLLARYLVQAELDSSQYINFDVMTSLNYVRSIFNKILHQYPIFSPSEINQNCILIEDFLKRNEHVTKMMLAKMNVQYIKSPQNGYESSPVRRDPKKGYYKCSDYLDVIVKQNELNQQMHQFMKFWTFKNKNQLLSFRQFQNIFKTEGVCTFITEEFQRDLTPN